MLESIIDRHRGFEIGQSRPAGAWRSARSEAIQRGVQAERVCAPHEVDPQIARAPFPGPCAHRQSRSLPDSGQYPVWRERGVSHTRTYGVRDGIG